MHTPALEYEDVLRRGEERAAGARYRTFDEQGDVLALRSDMTIPIARVVATRYAEADPPLRFCYFAHAWRATERGVGEPREFLQAGLELIGADGARGRGRGAGADDRGARRGRACAATGSAWATGRSTAACSRRSTCPRTSTCRCSSACRARDLVGLEMRVVAARPGSASASASCSCGLPELRGGPEVLERADGPRGRRRPGPARACTSCWPSAAWPTG